MVTSVQLYIPYIIFLHFIDNIYLHSYFIITRLRGKKYRCKKGLYIIKIPINMYTRLLITFKKSVKRRYAYLIDISDQ